MMTGPAIHNPVVQTEVVYNHFSPSNHRVSRVIEYQESQLARQNRVSQNKGIEALTEDNHILKTLTTKLQDSLMEAKRDNRILQRQLDILNEQGNDPKNTYKLKKEIRDAILEQRNNQLREENELQLLKLKEAEARIKQLESALLSERVKNVVSPEISDEIDEEKVEKIAKEIDLMEDKERKIELKNLISHLHTQKITIAAQEHQNGQNKTHKDGKVDNGDRLEANKLKEEVIQFSGQKISQDYGKKLVQVKENMTQRLCTYFYNDFLDAIDESQESDKHSALIFQLKMADRRADLSCIIHAHIQNYKE